MDLATRKILNEILNSDYRDLAERIDQNPLAVNTLGLCGESPAHISIYKDDVRMLEILLNAGADPNATNSKGDTLLHVSAKLGCFPAVKLLYETQRCILDRVNDHNDTALDIATAEVEEDDLQVAKLFGEWSSTDTDDDAKFQSIIKGRDLIADYIDEKIQFDRDTKVELMVTGTRDYMVKRRSSNRIIRGIRGIDHYTSQYENIHYSQHINDKPWTAEDSQFFESYHQGLDRIIHRTFACDFVDRSVKSGYEHVLSITQNEIRRKNERNAKVKTTANVITSRK